MFINLTPHEIRIGDRVIPPSGKVARCEEITTPAGTFDGVELINRKYGQVHGLPEPGAKKFDGTFYIVSAMVRMALPDRIDLASPGDLVRDETGKIVGCKNLVVN